MRARNFVCPPACLIAGRDVKHREDVRPPGLDIERLAVHNVRHAAHHHVAHSAALVVLHDVLEGAEEVLLEVEVGELSLLDKLGRQLAQRVHREERDFLHAQKNKFLKIRIRSSKLFGTKPS